MHEGSGKFRSLFWLAFRPAFLGASVTAVAAWWSWSGLPQSVVAPMTAAAAAGTAALVGLFVSRGVGGPLERLSQWAARLSMGRFDAPVMENSFTEMEKLAERLGHVAREFEDMAKTGASETQSGEAILASIEEGVIAVDQEMRIIRINPKAREILNIMASKPEGLPLDQAVGRGELARFAMEGLDTKKPGEREVSTDTRRERFLRLTRSPLYHQDGRYWGLVMTVNDVTRIRRLENLRRDFAANVSHELRTPVTTIKGFVETLQRGGVDDPEKARGFLEIIGRHVDRLALIIEDLLSLSRIERDGEAGAMALAPAPVRGALENAIDEIAPKAEKRSINIELDCAEGLIAPINAPLVETAVKNLVDNAVNYSADGGTVWVTAAAAAGFLSIHVRDEGIGMDKAHLDRVFERFYRVDEARSRKLGGTGLGLSIVKHVALAHGGRVTAQSAPGEGSVFSIHIPLDKEGSKADGRRDG